MTIFVFGIIIGFVAASVIMNLQDTKEESNNTAAAIVVFLILLWFCVGIGTGDIKHQMQSMEATPTPTESLGR